MVSCQSGNGNHNKVIDSFKGDEGVAAVITESLILVAVWWSRRSKEEASAMGLLDKLWDETLAGPRPDNGLGKLRKTGSTNSTMATPCTPEVEEGLNRLRESRASAEYQRSNNEAIQVTQSITIIKPPGYLRSLSLDTASSPAVSSPPISPSSLTPRERENPWRSNKHKKGSEKSPRAEPRSPTVYDWVVISCLEK